MQPKLELVYAAPHAISRNQSGVRTSMRRQAWLASAADATERLDATAAEKLVADAFQNARVILFGFSGKHQREIRHMLRSIGCMAIATGSDLRQLQDVCAMGMGFTHVFVNIDAFEDVEDAVVALMAFRSNAPGMILVAFSESVSGDDFGTERRRICDVTLKLPVSAARLTNGMVTAFLNHADEL